MYQCGLYVLFCFPHHPDYADFERNQPTHQHGNPTARRRSSDLNKQRIVQRHSHSINSLPPYDTMRGVAAGPPSPTGTASPSGRARANTWSFSKVCIYDDVSRFFLPAASLCLSPFPCHIPIPTVIFFFFSLSFGRHQLGSPSIHSPPRSQGQEAGIVK